MIPNPEKLQFCRVGKGAERGHRVSPLASPMAGSAAVAAVPTIGAGLVGTAPHTRGRKGCNTPLPTLHAMHRPRVSVDPF